MNTFVFLTVLEVQIYRFNAMNSGLGHSLDQDSVMRPIYKGYSWANLKLGAKDIDGVEKLYGDDPMRFKKDGIFTSRPAFEGKTIICQCKQARDRRGHLWSELGCGSYLSRGNFFLFGQANVASRANWPLRASFSDENSRVLGRFSAQQTCRCRI